MKTVYKYPLYVLPTQELDLPEGAEVLRVAGQGEQLYLWALVDPDAPEKTRLFSVTCTGDPVSEGMRHVETVLREDGDRYTVWHVFEKASNVNNGRLGRVKPTTV